MPRSSQWLPGSAVKPARLIQGAWASVAAAFAPLAALLPAPERTMEPTRGMPPRYSWDFEYVYLYII